MNIQEFTVLIAGSQGAAYRIVPLEENLGQLGVLPRVGDLLVASADGGPVPGVDEDDTPVLLELELVEVVQVILDPYSQLAIIMVEDAQDAVAPIAPDAPTEKAKRKR